MGSQSFEPEDGTLTIRNVALSDNSVAMTNVGPGGKLLTIIGVVYGYCEIAVTLSNGDCYLYRLSVGGAPRPSGAATTAPQTPVVPTATTTTTAKPVTTTTTVTTTDTTTTTVTTTTTAPDPVKAYLRGYNDWGFINNRKNLGLRDPVTRNYFYMLSEADKAELFSRLSNTEVARIEEVLSKRTNGSCYGMSVTSILQYYGFFSPDQLVGGTDSLAEITEGNLNDRTRSAINYYQMLQYTKVMSQSIRTTERMKDEKKLRPLIESLKQGKPVLLGYTYNGPNNDKFGHAVVAYEIVSGQGILTISSTERFQYDTRIRIYDNLSLTSSEVYDMFVNTKTWTWCIPNAEDQEEYDKLAIMNLSSHRSGVISLVCTESELMNYHGLFLGSETGEEQVPDVEYERACMNLVPMNNRTEFGTAADPYDGSLFGAGEDGDIQFSANFLGDDEEGQLVATMDSDLCYFIGVDKPEAMDVSMEYEFCLLHAAADSAKKVTVSPSARIECAEASGSYQLSLVQDEGHHATDWYTIEVSGKDGGTVLLTSDQEKGGWIMQGDSLKNVKVNVKNRETAASAEFSTNYKEALIYEIDENTVGIAVDTDKNGSYETTIAKTGETPEYLRGDADGDGEITNKDAQMVLVAYTDSLGTGVVDLPEAAFTAADVDGDGKVGAGDAQYILIYYTMNTIAGTPTAWEDLLGG